MNFDEQDTLSLEDNLSILIHDLFQGQHLLEQEVKTLYAKLLTSQVLVTSLLEEQKELRDRIERLEGGRHAKN